MFCIENFSKWITHAVCVLLFFIFHAKAYILSSMFSETCRNLLTSDRNKSGMMGIYDDIFIHCYGYDAE